MSGLTRGGTAKPISRNQISTRMERGEILLPVQLTTSRIGNHARLIHTMLKVLTIRYILVHVSGVNEPKGQTALPREITILYSILQYN